MSSIYFGPGILTIQIVILVLIVINTIAMTVVLHKMRLTLGDFISFRSLFYRKEEKPFIIAEESYGSF